MNRIILYTLLISFLDLNANGSVFPDDSLKVKKDSLKKIQLEEISINAVRAERKLPVTESTLTKEDLEQNYTGQEMPVILAKTPALSWYSDGGNYTGYSYLRLRGIDQTRINFTLNGAPLNEPEDQGAYFSNYPDFLNSVRSIQVQRGVGVSTNGTASFAGSVNMESPSLNDSAYTELSTSYGSYNTYRLSPEFNTGLLKNNWSFYGRYSNTGSDGFREHSGTKGQSFFFSGGYVGKKSILKFTTFTGFSKNQMAYLAISDSSLKTNYRANFLTKDEKDEFKQTMAMLQYIVPLGKYSFINSTVYYTYLEGGYDILFSPDLYNFSVRSDFFGGIINYQYQRNNLKINMGIHANDYVRQHYASIQPNESVLLYKNSGHKNEFASFLKVAYDIQKLTLFADLQYRLAQFSYTADTNTPLNIKTANWQFINPKGGISYSINNRHVAYASVGKTSREPTRNDMFAGYDNLDSLNYLEVGGLDRVKPETVIDIEVGVKFLFKKAKLDLNVYNMDFKNEIAAIGQLSYIGLPLRKNVEASYRRGVELNFVTAPIYRFTFSTQANLSSNQIKNYTTDYDSVTYKNVQPLLTPQIIFNQAVAYDFTKFIKAEVNARYLSEAFLDNSNNAKYTVPSSLIFNTSVNFIFLKQHSLNFMINNIADQKYYTAGYVQAAQPYYFAMATRNYFVTLKLKF
ncbi:MAG: TonB-dependent receptor [Bacteroidia bacterium]|nr:TonB-dependent receptor [Bacteroidia bacterium]